MLSTRKNLVLSLASGFGTHTIIRMYSHKMHIMGVYGTARALMSSAAIPCVYRHRIGIGGNARRYRAPTVQVPRTCDSMPVATTRVAANDIDSAETLKPAGDVPGLDSLPYVIAFVFAHPSIRPSILSD